MKDLYFQTLTYLWNIKDDAFPYLCLLSNLILFSNLIPHGDFYVPSRATIEE